MDFHFIRQILLINSENRSEDEWLPSVATLNEAKSALDKTDDFDSLIFIFEIRVKRNRKWLTETTFFKNFYENTAIHGGICVVLSIYNLSCAVQCIYYI